MADTFIVENNIGLLIWKTSNYWQSNLRKILIKYKLSLNEYLILKSIQYLLLKKTNIYQNEIAELMEIDISVTSVTLKLLENKKYISRKVKNDNRKKIIEILKDGIYVFNKVDPLINTEEQRLFNILNDESFNFTNSLKLLLGKKIRIKAKNQN